jgi:hypothetical protein
MRVQADHGGDLMYDDIFAQATKDALSLLGKSALLREGVPCQVNIERDVQLTGMDTPYETAKETRGVVLTRDVMTIEAVYDPKTRDTVRVGEIVMVDDVPTVPVGVNYRLDALVDDAGPWRRFAIIKL